MPDVRLTTLPRGTLSRAIRVAVVSALGVLVLCVAAPGVALAENAASVTPSTVAPGGTVTFSTTCPPGTKSANLSGSALGLPARVPMTPGDTPGSFSARVTVPTSTMPGSYPVTMTCADNSSGVATLVVSPTGPVGTGDGSTSHGPNTTMLAVGGALVVVAGVGATLLLRHRKPTT